MPLTSILPYESYTLTSKLTVDEVKKRIYDNLEMHERSSPRKPYGGRISGHKFVIWRIINYGRSSFLPKITGYISYSAEHTIIKIKMRPILFLIIFMAFWLGCPAAVFIFLLIVVLFLEHGPEEHPALGILIVSLMILFGWALMYFGFKFESSKSKKFLASLLEGNEIMKKKI